MRRIAIAALTAAVFYTVFAVAWAATRAPGAVAQMPMATPSPGSARDPTPAVKGFYKGREITFIHTEASDPEVAGMLTRMMGPQVLVVRSLAQVPDRLLAEVYVFTNGVRGEGPFGFQPDVFDSAPGDPRYTPLRRVNLVTWQTGATPRVLRSVDEITAARASGTLMVRRPGAVVNMPFLTWPGGRR